MPVHFHSNHGTLDKAFRIAIGDLHSSILPFQSGLLDSPRPVIMAGLDYESPWTRDAAINVWNAGSLLFPEVAKNTLLGVLERNPENGTPRIGGQYWDKIIWAAGAWHHHLVTGDRPFLELGYRALASTLVELERDERDPRTGLFRGGACFQDGIAGYPDRYARTHGSSNIQDWVRANPQARHPTGFGLPMKACSTNCLYYAAYGIAAEMAARLAPAEAPAYRKKAARLKTAILRRFWDKTRGALNYLVDDAGSCTHQEGLGVSFALLFGLLGPREANSVIAAQHVTPHGIPCVWPTFERYRTPDGLGFGRHSGTVWPHVQGFWAEAAARQGRPDLLMHELMSLASKAVRDAQFTEIYHPVTGAIYGGRQESDQGGEIMDWDSCRRQSWSATAYLRMILHGVCGFRFRDEALEFEPLSLAPLGAFRIGGLAYRQTRFSIEVAGAGTRVKRCLKNGRLQRRPSIHAQEKGEIALRIEMA